MSSLPQDIGYQDNTLFKWVEGKPRPASSQRAIQRDQIQELYHAAGALPYRGEWDADTQQYVIKDERFRGCTMAEVAVMREWDDAVTNDGGRARERVMDRILGKPKQAIESKSMTMSYSEYLEMALQDEQRSASEATTIDVHYSTVVEEDLLRGV